MPETQTIHLKKTTYGIVWDFITKLLQEKPDFTGKLEINFKDGVIMDINKTERTKF